MKNDLIFRIAWMYYQEGMTQQAIARQLNINRFKVMDYLARAKAEGIVQISLKGVPFHCLSIEKEIKEKFGLEDAVIIPTPSDADQLKSLLGQACAEYLTDILQPGMLLGTAWGTTVYQVGEQMKSQPEKQISVITMLGGLTYSKLSVILNPYDVAIKMAEKLGGYCHFILAPAIVDTPEIRDALLSDNRVVNSLEMAEEVDVALVGLGDTTADAAMVKTGFLADTMLEDLRSNGVVGDILGRYYDRKGRHVPSALDERVIGLTLDGLAKIKQVVAVAGGRTKVQPILGALSGKYCQVLVTDEETAQAVIKEA